MADVLIAGAGLQDTKIGVKTATSNVPLPPVDGMPAVAAGEFAELVVQLLTGPQGQPASGEGAAEGGNTLPPALPQEISDDPSMRTAVPDTSNVPVLPQVIPVENVVPTVVATQKPLEPAGADVRSLEMSSDTSSNGARRYQGVFGEKLSTLKKDAVLATAAGHEPQAVPDPVAPGAIKATADLQSVAMATSETAPDLSPTSAIASPVAAPAQGAPTGARPVMDSAAIPVQQRGFEQTLGDRVVWMTHNRIQSAELQVNPPELGPIEVRISVNNDQAAVSFGASHPGTRDALEAALPRLRELLGQQGLNLADVNVSHHSQAHERGETSGSSPQGTASPEAGGEGPHESPRVAIGMLDVFA